MRVLAYLIGLLLALPGLGAAAALLALEHVIAVRNPFKRFFDFLMALGWGLPIAMVVFLILVVAAFFRLGQIGGAGVILLGNVATLIVILRSEAAPKDVSEAIFLIPALVSMALMAQVLWASLQAGQGAAVIEPVRQERSLERVTGK